MAFARFLQTARNVLLAGPQWGWKSLTPRPVRDWFPPAVRFPPDVDVHLHGRLETVHMTPDTIKVTGWLFHEKRQVLAIGLVIASPSGVLYRSGHYGLERPDVVQLFGSASGRFSGFWIHTHHHLRGAVDLFLEIWYSDAAIQRIRLGTLRIPRDRFGRTKMQRYGKYLRTLMQHGRAFDPRYMAQCLKEIQYMSRSPSSFSFSHILDRVRTEPVPLPHHTEPVDIIVPVYNALDHLKRLMHSLFHNTRDPYRLILVDDCSTDPDVWPYLQEVARQRPGTVLLRNETNRGFPATVNRGIRAARHHFVILNTDVEVPPGWLERLMAPIMAHPDRIATTTPFTNGSTLFGFPRFMAASPWEAFFDGMSVATVDRFFRRIDTNGWEIRVPSGFGFCMGVNRHVVREIGLLDANTFGRGYGEDADWCMRAWYRGYQHVLVPNLLVYHKCGASFDVRTKARLAQNWDILVRKHPMFPELVERFIAADPVGPLRDFLFLWTVGTRGARFILHTPESARTRARADAVDIDPNQQPVLIFTIAPHAHTGRLLCAYRRHGVIFPECSIRDVYRILHRIDIAEAICTDTALYRRIGAMASIFNILEQKTGIRFSP